MKGFKVKVDDIENNRKSLLNNYIYGYSLKVEDFINPKRHSKIIRLIKNTGGTNETTKSEWKENKRIREIHINRSSMPRTERAIKQQ